MNELKSISTDQKEIPITATDSIPCEQAYHTDEVKYYYRRGGRFYFRSTKGKGTVSFEVPSDKVDYFKSTLKIGNEYSFNFKK